MTIQSVMLVSLGFFIAGILAMMLAPAYRRRADRMATERVRRALPVSLEEVRADKDRLRAEHAIVVHRLETRAEEARLNAARQKVELNRRDSRICALEEEASRLRSDLEENVNARRVLEHNISDRLPHVMSRLDEAHTLLDQRDQQITILNTGAQKSIRALDEAMMLNAQQRSELDRLRNSLSARSAGRFAGEGGRGDSEAALRSELEALRSRTRSQSSVIARLHELLSKYGADVTDTEVSGTNGVAAGGDGAKPEGVEESEFDRLRRDLMEARATLQSARVDTTEVSSTAVAGATSELIGLKTKVDEQGTEIKRLTAALSTYQAAETSGVEGKAAAAMTSRIAAKARLNALQAQVASQDESIKRLRSELAASNERLAQQAAHFRDEMRRIGAGTRPTTADVRRSQKQTKRPSLAERVQQPRSAEIVPLPQAANAAGPPLASGSSPVPVEAARTGSGNGGHAEAAAGVVAGVGPRVADFIKALGGSDKTTEADSGKAAAAAGGDKDAAKVDAAVATGDASSGKAGEKAGPVAASAEATPAAGGATDGIATDNAGKPRQRLMDRISGLNRKEA